jgi:hypothetical protein
MTVLVDTGVLFALFDSRDAWHKRSIRWLREFDGELVVPAAILGEIGHFLERDGDEHSLINLANWLLQSRVTLESLTTQDLRRVALLLSKYPELGFVDASNIALAERLFIETIATTDRRHFTAIRPSHARHFTLVP